jgi:hypothetical protein
MKQRKKKKKRSSSKRGEDWVDEEVGEMGFFDAQPYEKKKCGFAEWPEREKYGQMKSHEHEREVIPKEGLVWSVWPLRPDP